jgi:signal transduction histidine kinase
MGQVYKSGYLLILGYFFLKIPDMVLRYIQKQKEILEEKNEYVLDLLLEKREKKTLKTNLSELNALNSELQQKTSEIENQNKKLSELVQTKDRLISFISHDLRNSFSTMSSIIETTRDNLSGLDAKELSTAMDILHKHSLTNHVLFENLLQWAKLQRGQVSINKEKVNLFEFCLNTFKYHELALQSKELKLDITIDDDIVILADPIILTSVCNNIIGNAIKFSHRAGKIEITAGIEGNQVVVHISDDGIGINERTLSRIFSIESCKSTPGTEGEKGSGFGLILCKELIERNGGTIQIESKEGKGTTISLTFVNVNFLG